MANYIENDHGVMVPAVGAPGSIARMRAQYPKFINSLSGLYMQSETDGEYMRWAYQTIADRFTGLERESLLSIAQEFVAPRE